MLMLSVVLVRMKDSGSAEDDGQDDLDEENCNYQVLDGIAISSAGFLCLSCSHARSRSLVGVKPTPPDPPPRSLHRLHHSIHHPALYKVMCRAATMISKNKTQRADDHSLIFCLFLSTGDSHSLFVDCEGMLYACGHGGNGRTGLYWQVHLSLCLSVSVCAPGYPSQRCMNLHRM